MRGGEQERALEPGGCHRRRPWRGDALRQCPQRDGVQDPRAEDVAALECGEEATGSTVDRWRLVLPRPHPRSPPPRIPCTLTRPTPPRGQRRLPPVAFPRQTNWRRPMNETDPIPTSPPTRGTRPGLPHGPASTPPGPADRERGGEGRRG